MSQQAPDPDCVLRGCDSPITSLLWFSPAPKGEDKERKPPLLLAGTVDGFIHIWDLQIRRIVYKIEAHANSVLSIHSIIQKKEGVEDGTRILTQGRDGNIHLWIVIEKQWTISRTYSCNSYGFCSVTIIMYRNSYIMAAPAENQTELNILPLDSGEILHTIKPKGPEVGYGMLISIKFATDSGDNNPKLLAAYEDGSIVLWDINSEQALSRLNLHSESVMCMDYELNLNRGVSGSVNEEICLWTIEKDTWTICERKKISVTNPGLNCARFRGDGKLFAVGGWDSKVRLFGSKQGKPLAALACHKESIQCLTFGEYNNLIVGSKDGTISIWSVYQ